MANRVNYEDLIVDLYIFDKLERESGNMSTAKLIFLLEQDLYNKCMIGPHYIMKRYPMGPYNNKIGINLKNLALNGYIEYRQEYYDKAGKKVFIFSSNQKTSKFIKSIDNLIQEYSAIFNALDNILNKFGCFNAEELKGHIYSLNEVGIDQKKVEEYELHSVIINPKFIRNPVVNFNLEADWYDTVEVLLNPDILLGLQKGIEDARQGNFIVH